MAKGNSLRSLAQKLSLAKRQLADFDEKNKDQTEMFDGSNGIRNYIVGKIESIQKDYDRAKALIDENPEQYQLYLKLKGIYG